MTKLLTRLLGRLPIGWLQLIHNPTRLMAAIAGVTFANLLVLMQLGFQGALIGSISIPYEQMNADLLVSAADINTLADGGPLPRRRMYQALGVDGVASANPFYYGKISWKQPDGTARGLDVFGIDPTTRTLNNDEVNRKLPSLLRADTAIIDRATRNVPKALFDAIEGGTPMAFETNGRTLTVVSTFAAGGGFTADGYLIVSDQTFLRLFPQRAAGAPNHIFIKLAPGASPTLTREKLAAVLPAYDSLVRTVPDAIALDTAYQTTQKPVGLIFGFGVIMGALVGVIIVYQVLATDVADHMKEYATFKAIGYPHRFFLSVVLEEAMILALLGFLPGILMALGLYRVLRGVTGLPLAMSMQRGTAVLVGTIVMCAVSGAIATRRLARANPADLF